MEKIRQLFGEDFIRAITDFSKCVTESAESIINTIVEIGDAFDKALGYDFGVTATHIVYILDKNEKFRRMAENLIGSIWFRWNPCILLSIISCAAIWR